MESIIQIDKGEYFNFKYGIDLVNDKRKFLLHYHPYSEIYLLVSGKADFFIDGSTYILEPFDIMLVPPYKIHQPYPEFNTVFERFVINVYPDFYEKMKCSEYERVFSDLDNFMYKIPSRIVRQTNFINVLNTIRLYSKEYQFMQQPIIRYKIGELLYILNSIDNFEKYNDQNLIAQKIIEYIDKKFKTITNLNEIAMHFNYTKSYLCFTFKKATGMTIAHYITLKRIEYVKSHLKNGDSISNVCLEAGFTNYGNFAYNYKKISGRSPKTDLK